VHNIFSEEFPGISILEENIFPTFFSQKISKSKFFTKDPEFQETSTFILAFINYNVEGKNLNSNRQRQKTFDTKY